MKTFNTITPRYAMLHGFYQASYSLTIGYASVYLLAQGYSDAIIGIILAVANGAAAVLQPALGTLLDKKKSLSVQMVSVFMLLIMIVLSASLISSMDLLPRAICIVLIFTLEFSLQPMVNALCFILEHSGIRLNFGFSRGIGSISYAIASVIIGRLVSQYSESLLPVFYVAFFAGFFAVFLSLWKVPGKTPSAASAADTATEDLPCSQSRDTETETSAAAAPLSDVPALYAVFVRQHDDLFHAVYHRKLFYDPDRNSDRRKHFGNGSGRSHLRRCGTACHGHV